MSEPTIIVAIITGIALVMTSYISAKYAKRKTENSFLTEMQGSYKKLIEDLEETNKRLIDERQNEIEKKEEYRKEIDIINDKMKKILTKYALIEPQRCLILTCLNRVSP